MDTHRLKYFQRIAEEGSITRAARLLGIAQPALSRQLQLLEEDLGVVLFRRNRRGVELTDAGERLRASTAAPLRQLELAVQYAGSPLAKLERNVLLGLPDTAVDMLAGPLLRALTAALPAAVFSLTVGSTDQLVDAMLKGSVDIALINPVPDDRVFYRALATEELVLAGPSDCDLDAQRPIEFVDAIRRPVIIPRSATGIGTALRNAALRTKTTFAHRITTDSLHATLALIDAGLGYAVLPRSACQRGIDDGRIRTTAIVSPELTHQIGVAATAQLDLPRELASELGDTMRKEVTDLIRTRRWLAELHAPTPWNPDRG